MLRYFLPIYLLFYFGVAFVLPTYRVWRGTNVNPLVLGSSDSAHDYIGRIFKILLAGVAVVISVYSFAPQFYEFLKPFEAMQKFEIQIAGMILLILSLGWTILAQIQMGNSWRIGIDHERQTNLVRSGVFSISRNPIFLGMISTLAGLFLVLPNAFTLLIFVSGFVVIQIQVRLEEEYLTGTHQAGYEEYRRRVRRWL